MDSQDSDDTDIENVDGVNEENVQRYVICYCWRMFASKSCLG